MNRITFTELLLMHYGIVRETQGENASFGIRDHAILENALVSPFQEIFGRVLYPDIREKAAVLTYSLIANHPFEDGNKRIGIVAGMIFLNINGYDVIADNDDVYEAAMNTAAGEWKKEQLTEWFMRNSREEE